jgi:hypothetical protein
MIALFTVRSLCGDPYARCFPRDRNAVTPVTFSLCVSDRDHVLGECHPKKKLRAVDARGYRLLPQPEALFDPGDVFVGERGTPLRIGASTEIMFKLTLRFIAGGTWNSRSPTPDRYRVK